MMTFASRRSRRGLSSLAAGLRGVAVAAGAALLLAGCGHGTGTSSAPPKSSAKPVVAASSGHPSASATPASAASPAQTAAATQAKQQAAAQAQAKLQSMGVSDLLAAARTAYGQHKLVAPAGDNAMEYYEAVLAKDPGNKVATDALRETFPFGVPDVEKAISQSNFDEANREIDLLSKADPTNYTLTLLRSKLDAQKKLLARQQQEAQQKVQKAAELAAAQEAQAKQAAAAKLAAEQEATRLAQQQAAAKAAPTPATPPPPPKPAGITRGAQVISMAQAAYPPAAARSQTSGYAVVEFTVEADGKVDNVHVVSSQPRRVFDRAAIIAIERSKFSPAMQDGKPVSAVLQRRMDFKFGG